MACDETVSACFRKWELIASGAALDAEAGQCRARDASASSELFLEPLGDLEFLQRGFDAHLHEFE